VFYHRKLVPGDVPWIGCSHIIPASPVVLFYYTSAWKFGKDIEQALKVIKAQTGDYILPVRRLFSNGTGSWMWVTCSLWLPSENEIFGANAWGENGYGDGQKLHIPLYRDSYAYRIKRYNGSRYWWWLNTPSAGCAAYFCFSYSSGGANNGYASAVGGCAPPFCVA
jgi:hypothetical protein